MSKSKTPKELRKYINQLNKGNEAEAIRDALKPISVKEAAKEKPRKIPTRKILRALSVAPKAAVKSLVGRPDLGPMAPAVIAPIPVPSRPSFYAPVTITDGKKEKKSVLPYLFLAGATAPLAYVGWKLYEKSHTPHPIPPVSDPNLLAYINEVIAKLVKAALVDINIAIGDMEAVLKEIQKLAYLGINEVDNEIKKLVPLISLTVHDVDAEVHRIVSALPQVVGTTIQDIDNEIFKLIPVNSLALKSDVNALKSGINGTVIGGINTVINAWNNFGFGPYSVFGVTVVPRVSLPHINTLGSL